jgi:hypothetical protein
MRNISVNVRSDMDTYSSHFLGISVNIITRPLLSNLCRLRPVKVHIWEEGFLTSLLACPRIVLETQKTRVLTRGKEGFADLFRRVAWITVLGHWIDTP